MPTACCSVWCGGEQAWVSRSMFHGQWHLRNTSAFTRRKKENSSPSGFLPAPCHPDHRCPSVRPCSRSRLHPGCWPWEEAKTWETSLPSAALHHPPHTDRARVDPSVDVQSVHELTGVIPSAVKCTERFLFTVNSLKLFMRPARL